MICRFLLLAVGAVAVAAGCSRAPEKLTPEAARARGDELLKEMSKTLSGLQTFAYTADEVREEVKAGKKVEARLTRRVMIRRPNSIAFTTKGDRDAAGWYDGKHLTLVSNTHKVWARGPMPPSLDEALDYLSAEYAIQMPTADLLYSSPYDALMTPDTKGGWVDVQTIGSARSDHLAYQQKTVDWDFWLNQEGHLPLKVKFVYKDAPGQPSVTVTYSDMDRSPQVTDDTFVAKIPEGYNRIKIMRHATVEDPAVEAVSNPSKAEPGAKPAK
jgi:hypothetical protein